MKQRSNHCLAYYFYFITREISLVLLWETMNAAEELFGVDVTFADKFKALMSKP